VHDFQVITKYDGNRDMTFTFEAPNADSFLEALLVMLRSHGNAQVADLLSGSKCTIIDTKQWAQRNGGTLWDGNATRITLAIPAYKYQEAISSIGDFEKDLIKTIGNDLIQPQVTGLEITEVTFSIRLRDSKPFSPEPYKSKNVTYDERTEFAKSLLYTLENALRDFVWGKIYENQGIAVLDKDFIKDWEGAKRKEALPPRKPLDSQIIQYSSFEQLRRIITQHENWEKIFKTYFGRQTSIISRLNELDEIRDTLAHNRILSEYDFNSFMSLFTLIKGCIEPD
jgi:hypothetical protein